MNLAVWARGYGNGPRRTALSARWRPPLPPIARRPDGEVRGP